MIYEGQVTYVTIDENGCDKTIKENYVVEEAASFTDAEDQLLDAMQGFTDADVVALKRSKVREIANKRESQDDLMWEATVCDIFTTDEGVEKEIKYKILLFSKTFDTAKAFMAEFLEQGYNMSLVGLKKTNFLDVLANE